MIAFFVTCFFLGLLSVSVVQTVIFGSRVRRLGPARVRNHRRAANRTVLTTIFVIASVEWLANVSSVVVADTALLTVHVSFAVLFLVFLIVVRYFMNGLQKRTFHRYFAYTTLFLFLGMLATGLCLLAGVLSTI